MQNPTSLLLPASAALVAGYVVMRYGACLFRGGAGTGVGFESGSGLEVKGSGVGMEKGPEAGDLYKDIQGGEDIFKEALEVVMSALRLYDPTEILVSFNGGKDATAVFHLFRAALYQYSKENQQNTRRQPPRMKAVYFHDAKKALEDTLEHVVNTCRVHNVDLAVIEKGYKEGITDLVSMGTRAFIIGTRSNDPNGKRGEFFAPSSKGWPSFLRVNPVVNWDYGTVWRFIKTFNIPYFYYYDQGYTSLGNRANTHPNPLLRNDDGSYSPAYMLKNWDTERALRDNAHTHSGSEKSELRMALVIIGDEVVSGKISDINTPYACKAIRRAGFELGEIVLVPDDIKQVSEAVRRLSTNFDIVVTSGGVGPTHDDVTVDAVAKAFDCGLRKESKLCEIIERYSPGAPEKMAMVPSPARLVYIEDASYPVILCWNVYVLPGVPRFFQEKLKAILKYLGGKYKNASKKLYQTKVLLCNVSEFEYAKDLEAIDSRHEGVKIGSYPFVERDDCKCVVTVEGESTDQIQQAVKDIQDTFPPEQIVGIERGHRLLSKEERERSRSRSSRGRGR